MVVDFVGAWLAVLATLLAVGTAFTGIGLTIRRGFGLQALDWNDVFVSFWVGYGATLLFLILWNFILPIGATAQLIVLVAGGLGTVLAGPQWRTLVPHDSGRPRPWEVLVAGAAALWVANNCMAAFTSWDGVLYHVQAVKWAKAYAVIPGIANLHGPLAFNNSSFLYDAMVDSGWWEGRGFHVGNGVLLLGAVLQSLVGMLQWLRGGSLATGRACFSFLMLALALHMARDLASYSADLPVTLVVGAAAMLMYDLLDVPAAQPARADDAYGLFALAVLLAAAVTIKSTVAVFAAVSLAVVILARFGRRPWQAASMPRSLVWTSLVVVSFAGAWIARGIVMSGYPFFPIAVGGLPVDWRAPIEHARAEMDFIAMTERAFTWRIVGSNWIRVIFLQKVNAAFVPASFAIIAFVSWWRDRKNPDHPARSARHTWWLALPLGVAIGVWFLTAPSHRYSPALFWSFAALCVSESQRVRRARLGGFRTRWANAVLIALAISPIVIDPIVQSIRTGTNPALAAVQHNFVGPGTGQPLPPLGGHVSVTVFTTSSGLELNTPTRTDARGGLPNGCWNAPVPCTPNPAPNLQLRVPGRLQQGFRVDGDWAMLDWPYYWQSYFLPEWRLRTGNYR
jgi:hypothetical protein